ncbi:MAG: 1,4-dihydroxy-2-naphthoate octaprenyltransferase [Crocinitomicaceae bacterium]|jgi:1,4-dihydroxy-2-naphthoate polyprenyltransferase|nr:1,4-dihydroxy-2-naphthoate octaprenyltransferase [Crocinitomicaceae bacterium]MDG1858987.1 1,4-dihydroxy-2-naphthoate octaprenyltransferase [Emcibacteraceae bacterium]MDG2465118.1 1,4-dihydroxy-2-naphthoate octaprenyltransferase [Crocinitomicaceae bacterium]
MDKTKVWLKAMRLRTLPLSLSGIIVGSLIALKLDYWNALIFILSLFTTIFLQVLSNLANDLGDHLKGTDNEDRVGPKRTTQTGEISVSEMKKAVAFLSALSLIFAGLLIWVAGREMSSSRIWMYIFLGIGATLAALFYTLGKKAYGYSGKGDLFVFIFFGLVSVLGVYGLYAPFFYWQIVPVAVGVGLLSVAVLNLNNMRDHVNDKKSDKFTLVVKMGIHQAKIYHTALILLACFAFAFSSLMFGDLAPLSIIALIPLLFHLKRVLETDNEEDLDPELKKVALNTFAISLIFGILINVQFISHFFHNLIHGY